MQRVEAPRAEAALRVVVADDDAAVRSMLRVWLDHDPRFAFVGETGSGREVPRLVGELGPDAVILDLSMPDGDGLAALSTLRASGSDVPVVVFSGAASSAVAEQIRGFDNSTFVCKGGTLGELGAALERHRPVAAPVVTSTWSDRREAVAGAALASAVAALGLASAATGAGTGPGALIAGAAVALAVTFALPIRRVASAGRTSVVLDGHLFVAVALLLPPAGAALAVGWGTIAGCALARPRRSRGQALLSSSLFSLSALGQAQLVSALTGAGSPLWARVLVAALSYVVALALQLVVVTVLVERRTGTPAALLLRRHAPVAARLLVLFALPVGAALGVLGHVHADAVAFLAVPQVGLLLAARYDGRNRRERDVLRALVAASRAAHVAPTPREADELLLALARRHVDPTIRLADVPPAAGAPATAASLGSTTGPWLVGDGVDEEEQSLLDVIAAVGAPARENARLRARELHDARHDPLTGLANRRLLREALDQTTASWRRIGTACSVVYVDLDRFKDVNDTHGHAAGDEVLKEVARRLQAVVRPFDLVARPGGDEFVLVLAGVGADLDVAERIAGAARTALARPLVVRGVEVAIGASVGVAVCPTDGTSADELLRRADERMFDQKRAIRGR